MFSIEYAIVSFLVGTYANQTQQVAVYEGIQDLDAVFDKFEIKWMSTPIERHIRIGVLFIIAYWSSLILYMTYCYTRDDSQYLVISCLIPSIFSVYKSVLYTCTMLMLEEKFTVINKIIEKFQENKCEVCCGRNERIFTVTGYNFMNDSIINVNNLCEVHLLRSIRLIYEKISDVCTALNRSWNFVQPANIFWAFSELLYQCLVWYEILYKDLAMDWTKILLSFLAIFTATFTTFIFFRGCTSTKLEALSIKKNLHYFYVKSNNKLIIRDDVKSFLLSVLHRPSPFFDNGNLKDTSNSLAGGVNALVTILVFGIQYNLPKTEGIMVTNVTD
ncbi:hypothetical protein FQR65_LT11763 [Abscondita terminalis]|nr:hypothetical protein FQR65_LT11763 [Abscondita terminalis]